MKSEAAARRRRQHGSSARGRRRREDFNSGRVDCRPLQHLSTRRTGIIFLLFPFCPEINFQPLLTSVPIVLQVPIKGMEQGESVSLPVFIQDMSPILLRTTTPGHTGQRQPRPFLSPQSQRLIFRLIELLFEEIPVRCFRQIRRVHIMVCLQSERPFFSSRIQESPDRTRAQMCQNVNSMGLLIRDMIIYQRDQGGRAGKPSVLPREVKHLINLMLLPDPIRMKVPIQYHSCLVPIEYRGFLFTIEYQFIMDVLRYADREGFRYVLRGLEPVGDWSVNVRNSNRYLQQFFNKCPVLSMKKFRLKGLLQLYTAPNCNLLKSRSKPS
ncbi:uncharacterized protein LOC125514676 isoform X2 [Triticum urartu]|uniref:uncharacterized protein LOC125514676 isoform X2 n=1 Tax=Triticum urartu TaxID=4572 RepID=UPI0020446173|nr:uncharacterized protein LOC125514676 isoform X2 [Triticum urartu]